MKPPTTAASPADSLEQFVAALPKAELHIHLEGSVDPETLWEMAVRQRSQLAESGRAALDELFAPRGFAQFIKCFKTVCLHLETAADYEMVTHRVLQRLAEQNVRYAEVILSAGVILWKGQDIDAIFAGVATGAQRAQQDFGIRARWIFDAVRQFPTEDGWQVARAAANLRSRGVIALGIGGDESANPASNFREIFEFARKEGLHVVAHAGETVGPDSIWSALNDLGAERIGHGLTAAKDANLMRHLAEKQIPVEICLTSNLRTGGIAQLEQHPLRRYFDAGLQVSLHSDDPALFGTTLHREYLAAHHALGFTKEELRQLAMNSFEAAFLPANEKQAYLAAFLLSEGIE